ncbi:ribosomal protein S18-alanine N-acetyltransferase [Bacillus sp. FSL W7-1360]
MQQKDVCSEPSIRMMTFADIDQVLAVERSAFKRPWKREAFESELNVKNVAHYFVMEAAGEIIGYCGVWKVIDEAQITNIAIHKKAQGNAYGEWLLRFVMTWLHGVGAEKLSLEVRPSNLAALALYQKLGFNKIGIRKNYYADDLEDAWVMEVKIGDINFSD